VALAIRARALGSFSWPDELTWLERSAAFVTALERGDLAGTYLSDHPGVVPMWGYGGALYARAMLTGDRVPLDGLAAEDYFADVPTQLATAAWWAVIVTSLTVVASFWLMIPLLGRAGAALAGLLLALDPFYLAHSRIVHVDGLLASFMLLATLSLLVYLKHPQRRGYLVLSGFMAGLALLTKTPALFLIPLVALALGVQWLLRRLGREAWGRLGQVAGAFGLWMLVTWITFLLLWPATWRDPLFFLWRIYKASRWGVVVSHGSNFFLGQVVEDPGSLFYAVVLPFRLSPLVLLLLPVAVVLLVVAWRRREDVRLPIVGLASIFFFTLMMTLAAKKGDRYLLPAFLMADVVAAWAVVSLVDKVAECGREPARWRRIGYGLSVGLVLLTSLLWLRLAPYYGAYFNPLLGGGKTAVGSFAFGQGEGLDLAAQYLNEKEGSQELLVVSFYPPQFRYYFEGDATSLRRGDWDKTWTFADYVVFYVSQVQRQLPSSELVEFFASQEPEYVARLGGVDFALVYRSPLLLSGQPAGVEEMLEGRRLAGELELEGYALSASQATPGETLYATLLWQALTQIGVDYALQVQLVSEEGEVVWEQAGPSYEEYFPTWWWPPGRTMYDRYEIPLPDDLEPGPYWLLVSAQAPDGSRTLEPHGPTLDGWPGSLVVGPVEIKSAP
jgi:4-amino-4-deoxy-L-arabinose transferase-like glycosyltransferase